MLIHENSEGIGGHPPQKKTKTKHALLDVLKIHF